MKNIEIEKIDCQILKNIAVKAGDKIMEIYQREDFSAITDFKADDSPLTLADKEAHKVIASGLEASFIGIPVLSEEGRDISYEERKEWNRFWLVDPLDGTKEFIKRNGQFTVNIALIEDGAPVLGVIYIPATRAFYFGQKGIMAFREDELGRSELRTSLKISDLVAVGSQSHSSPEEQTIMNKFDIKEMLSKGSSLKFCMVAEGKADVYYRHGPTMEWDTAAGQAIVEAAGGMVLDMEKKPFRYNKQNLLNDSFYCLSNKNLVSLL